MFWLTAVLLQLGAGVAETIIWVAVVFVSVLIHELGHAAVALGLGGQPEIRLRAFGGVTYPMLRKKTSTGQEILLSVAGPLAGVVLGGLVWLAAPFLHLSGRSLGALAVEYLLYTSFAWALLNLLPILPLDGGHVLEAVISGVRKKPSQRQAAIVSIAVGLGVAGWAFLVRHDRYLALFVCFFVLQNFGLLQQAPRAREAPERPSGPTDSEQADVRRYTETARQALAAGDDSGALAAAQLLEGSEGAFRQSAGLRIRAGVLLASGRNEEAARLGGQSYSMYPTADAAAVAARGNSRAGDRAAASAWIKRALEAGAPAAAVRADAELSQLLEDKGSA